jgi:flagellar hook-length control protein FliK
MPPVAIRRSPGRTVDRDQPDAPIEAPINSPAVSATGVAVATPVSTIPLPAPVVGVRSATPADQVVTALVPLRTKQDGTHELTIALHPAELGPIQLVARLDHGALHIDLASASEAARAVLRDALPQLRTDLVGAGFGSVGVVLGEGSNRSRPQDQRPGQSFSNSRQSPVTTAVPIARSRAPAGRLDALL